MVKVVNSVSDALSAMQKETGGLKARVKADLQRAPVRGVRLKGCANGRGSSLPAHLLCLTCLGFYPSVHCLFAPLYTT